MRTALSTIFFATLIFSFGTEKVFAGTTPPFTSIVQTPSSPDGNNSWYITPVKFDLTATDLESGVKEINYRISGGTWQQITFSDTLNLVQNPSFENGLTNWDTIPEATADSTQYAPGFANTSAKITSTDASGTRYAITNSTSYAVASAYENMSASVWLKTEGVSQSANFQIYAIVLDEFGNEYPTLLVTSSSLSQTNDWVNLSLNFTAPENVKGVYTDIGLTGTGTVWIDAVNINSSNKIAQTSYTVATDNENHLFEYYAVDQAGNIEATKSVAFKLDATAPGNWYGSGATRGQGADHELYVYTNVRDLTSGLSTNTNQYQYHTEQNPTFGYFSNLLGCNSTWNAGLWTSILPVTFSSGDTEGYISTQRTDFCNSNWKICKTVKFYAEDEAGNSSTKDFCINGPWIRAIGGGIVRSNQNIDMIAEPNGDNTDGLIEAGANNIDFFTSSKDWYVRNSQAPKSLNYETIFGQIAQSKTPLLDTLVASNGVYISNGNFEIKNQTVPNGYSSQTFNQIVFVDGDLTVTNNVSIDESSTALFVVSGNVNIAKGVTEAGIAIIADGTINSAYNINEGESSQTLTLNGIYHANNFTLNRTLQGTNNDTSPSEEFIYEPKYLVQLKSFFGKNTVRWQATD